MRIDRARPPSRPQWRRTLPWLAYVLTLGISSFANPALAADSPSAVDGLLRLVPADASLVLTIEGLRDQARIITGSRLAAELGKLPAVKAWLASEKYRRFEAACSEIEGALGIKLADVRDQLLGDAVVLVLRLPPDAPPDPSRARGLLLLRARDPALLSRLINGVNSAQQRSGELARVADRRRGGTSYRVREFPADSGRPPEWYVGYPDGTFAFSNSEEMIQGVVDRKPPEASLGWRRSGGSPAPRGPVPAWASCPVGRLFAVVCRMGRWCGCTSIPAPSSGSWPPLRPPPSRPTTGSGLCCCTTSRRSSTRGPPWSGGTTPSSWTRSRRSTRRGSMTRSGDGPATLGRVARSSAACPGRPWPSPLGTLTSRHCARPFTDWFQRASISGSATSKPSRPGCSWDRTWPRESCRFWVPA